MKRLRYAGLALLVFSLMLSGCSLTNQGDNNGSGNNSSDGEASSATDSSDSEDSGVGAQSAKTTGEQPWFEKESGSFSEVPRSSSGGIWYYTEDKHPGSLDDEFEWEEVDVLHIQLSDKEYYGYKISPLAVELASGDLVKVTLKLERDGSYEADDDEAARVFIKVKPGALENKKFVVETDDGERLNTN